MEDHNLLPLTEEQLQALYTWVDEIPLSRPKRNITRDFSDGVLMAEIIKHFFPKLVELHNYSSANSVAQKLYNWNTLNRKVLRKINFQISKDDINGMVNCTVGTVERVLLNLQVKVQEYQQKKLEAKGNNFSADSGSDSGGDAQSLQTPKPAPVIKSTVASRAAAAAAAAVNRAVASNRPTNNNNNSSNNSHNSSSGSAKGASTTDHQQSVLAVQQMTLQLSEKDSTINELQETIEIMEVKIKKLEQLVKLKDSKIQSLINKMQAAGLN